MVCPPCVPRAERWAVLSSCSLNTAGKRVGESIFRPDPATASDRLAIVYALFSSPLSSHPRSCHLGLPCTEKGLLPGAACGAGCSCQAFTMAAFSWLAFLLVALCSLPLPRVHTQLSSSLRPDAPSTPCPAPSQPVGGQQSICVWPGRRPPLNRRPCLRRPHNPTIPTMKAGHRWE